MTAREIARWLDRYLDSGRYDGADPSKNGLQADNAGGGVSRVAFAVDACLEAVQRASAAGAGMLVVHHGLFWRDAEPVVGAHYRRIKALLDADMALYASHLPLDAHPVSGNNAGLAARLGLEGLEPFGEWHGATIGLRGSVPGGISLAEVLARLDPDRTMSPRVLPFGPTRIASVAVVSGGGADELYQAIERGVDCFVTGEIGHEEYHHALENGITVVAAGHYATETVGPRLVMAEFARDTGVDSIFIDVPTGL